MMDFQKYFRYGKTIGLDPYRILYSFSDEMSVLVHDDNIKSQEIGVSQNLSGKALCHGKYGAFSTDRIDRSTVRLMGDSILESAKYGKKGKATDFYSGKADYPELAKAPKPCVPCDLSALRNLALKISREARAMDKRIQSVEVSLSQILSRGEFANSFGRHAKQENQVLTGSIFVVCKDEDGDIRSGEQSFSSLVSLEELEENSREAREKAVKAAVDFFKAKAIPSGNYPVVLDRKTFATLLSVYLGQLSAKSVQEGLSLFAGQVGKKIASDKISLINDPLSLSLGASNFDADGVPTMKFDILKDGVLIHLFHSLESANKDKIEPNGCGIGNGQAYPQVVRMEAGKISFDSLVGQVSNGLYITDVSGLNSGIDGQTLHFSLPCEGYRIRDGKIAEAVSMIVVSGNLKDMMENVVEIADDKKEGNLSCIDTPSVLVSSLAIAGK